MGINLPLPFLGPWTIAQFWWLGIVLLFTTARRRNGSAGMHELWSRTRVVMEPRVDAQPTLRDSPVAAAPQADVERVGPFQVFDHVDPNLLLAYDGRLRRRVWIRVLTPGTPALAETRRDLSRPGRLHWLTGTRTADEWSARGRRGSRRRRRKATLDELVTPVASAMSLSRRHARLQLLDPGEDDVDLRRWSRGVDGHFFRALRSRGPNTIRAMTRMTSSSPRPSMIYGTGTRALSSSNQGRKTSPFMRDSVSEVPM